MIARLRGAWPCVLVEVEYAIIVPCNAASGFNVG